MQIPHIPSLPAEPSDLMLKGISITNEALRKDYDEVLRMLALQERELVLLWVLFFAILGAGVYHGRKTRKVLKELSNG